MKFKTVKFETTDRCICCGGDVLKRPATIDSFIAHRLGYQDKHIPCHTLHCQTCGIMFLDIRYTDEQMTQLYMNYRDEEYVSTREIYQPKYRELNKWFDERVPYMDAIEAMLAPHLSFPVRILDYGGDTGHNAPFATCRSLLYVYDIGTNPVVSDALWVDRITASLFRYDLIVCANVLEHVPSPEGVLRDILILMDPRTILFIEVPFDGGNKDCWHEHINYFTGLGIETLLSRCELKIIEVTEVKINTPLGFICQFLIVCRKATHESI